MTWNRVAPLIRRDAKAAHRNWIRQNDAQRPARHGTRTY